MEYDFSLFTAEEMEQYSKIIFGYMSAGFDFAWPIFAALGGISLFILVVVMIYRHLKG